MRCVFVFDTLSTSRAYKALKSPTCRTTQQNTHTQIQRTWVSVWPEWGWEQRPSLPLRKTWGLISALLSAGPFSQRLTHIWCCHCERLLNPETRPVFPRRTPAIGSVQRRPLPMSPVSEDLEQHQKGVPSAGRLCIKTPGRVLRSRVQAVQGPGLEQAKGRG